MKKSISTLILPVLLLAAIQTLFAEDLYKKYQPAQTSRVREATEWSIVYSFNATDVKSPRVLLIGDSICNGYNGTVRNKIQGKMNVSFWATSKCVTDPNYFRELDLVLSSARYDVISFNNGLHSLDTNRTEWNAAYRSTVAFIRAKCPKAKLYITNCTPLKDPALTAKSKELNEMAQKIAADNKLPIIDLFGLMNPLDRNKFWSDTFHFKAPAIEIQAQKIAETVLKDCK